MVQAATVIATPELCAALNAGEVVHSDVGATIPGVSRANLRQFVIELARAAVSGALHPDKFAVAIKSANVEPSDDVAEIIADVLWYVWVEVEGEGAAEPFATRLADLGREAMRAGLVTRRMLMEVSEGEFLEWAGLIVSYDKDKGWRKKEIQRNTRHVYVQRKFNLLREESEGYAKLVTLLNQMGAGAVAQDCIDAALGEVKALVGYFDLDPNRVCSLVLEAFAAQPANDAFLLLLPIFSADAVVQLLGFQFARYDTSTPPPGLYTIAAKLINAGYVALEALLGHLSPSDAAMAAAAKEGRDAMTQAVARIGVISLTGGTGDADGAAQAQPQQRTGQTAAALQLDPLPFAAPLAGADGGAGNQRLGLLAALLRVDAWEHAVQLMRWLAVLEVRDVGIYPVVGSALCSAVAAELAPAYRRLCPGGLREEWAAGQPRAGGGAATTHLSDRLLELLRLVGPHLYHDAATLTRLVRVVGAVLGSSPAAGPQHAAALEVLTANILPAASLLPGNAALVLEVWSVLAHLPYAQRFSAYSDLHTATQGSLLLTASAKLAISEVRRIVQRLAKPANKREAKAARPMLRMLAKIAHANPLAVADHLLGRAMDSPGLLAALSESLYYLTPHAFDALTFAILRQLSSPRRKLKADGVNLEEWFQLLAAFAGVVSKKHAEVELTALLQYVANQLKGCESLDLVLLKEVVANLTGVQAVFDVSGAQMDALAGSDTLKAVVVTQATSGSERDLQRGMHRLLRALRTGPPEQQLALPLLVLLAQQRKLITLQPQSSHLKLIAELYDKCHEVTLQYADFLRQAMPREEYKALMPSIEDLAHEYRIDPEIIFEVHRPLIRTIHPPAVPAADGNPPAAATPEAAPQLAATAAAPADQDDEGEEGEIAEGAAPEVPPPPLNLGGSGGDADGMDVEDGEVAPDPQPAPAPSVAAPAGGGPEWDALARQTATLAPEGGFRGMSDTLFATFWALQLYDLQVPTATYESAIAQLRSTARVARDEIETAHREEQRGYGGSAAGGRYGSMGGPPPLEAAAAVDVDALSRELERAEAAAAKLPQELKVQLANAAAVDARLMATRGAWLGEDKSDKGQAAAAREFVQYCVLPRILNSPVDALYTARFLTRAHSLGPPGFRLLGVLDRLFQQLGFLVRCSTPREATNLGIFFTELMAMVAGWREEATFARECATSEAFRTYKGGVLAALTHREFLKLSLNWHKKLTTEVFGSCLASADYMQMKNALLVLNRMARVYPAIREDAGELLRGVDPVADVDPREDLKTLATMYRTNLKAAINPKLAARDRGRALIETRAEYAGLKPPRRKPRAQPAAPKAAAKPSGEAGREAAEAERGGEKGSGAPSRRDSTAGGPKEGAAGPPPGFGSIGRQGSTAARRVSSAEGPERPSSGASRGEQQRERERAAVPLAFGREERREERPSTRPLRADAPTFLPNGGKESGRARGAEESAAGGERESKRTRVEVPTAAAAAAPRPEQPGRRSSRDAEAVAAPAEGAVKDASPRQQAPRRARDEAVKRERLPRAPVVFSSAEAARQGERIRSRPASDEREVEAARALARASLGEQGRRPQGGQGERPGFERRSRDGDRQPERQPPRQLPPSAGGREPGEPPRQTDTGVREQRGRERRAEEEQRGEGRPRDRQAPPPEERHPAREPAPQQPPPVADAPRPSRGGEAPMPAVPPPAVSERGADSDTSGKDRDGRRKRAHKEKRHKKEKKGRKDRERGASGEGSRMAEQPPAAEREGKRRRVDEVLAPGGGVDALPPRLRDRVGTVPQDAGASGSAGRHRDGGEERYRERGGRQRR